MAQFNSTTQGHGEFDFMNYPNYIADAIPFFIVSMAIELVVSLYTKQKVYKFADAVNSMSLGLCQEMVNIFVKPLVYVPYIYIWHNYAIIHLPPNNIFTWWIALFGIDFAYYWFHRFGHRVNLGWATHVPHHSSDEYNLTTATRQGAFQYLFGWIFYLPLSLVCHPIIYSFHAYFNRIFQFWVHTRVVSKLGFLEYIFVTPSHHRVHHGSNMEYIDKNYGGVFIFWDKMFGSFEEEKAEVRYGITTGLYSWDPIWGNMHYFAYMYELSKKLSGLKKLKVLYKGPEWTPTKVVSMVRKGPYVKYNEGNDLPYKTWTYILIQFVVAVALRKQIERHFEQLSHLALTLLAITVVWGLVTIGQHLSKRLNNSIEQIRIGLSCAMLCYVMWELSRPSFVYAIILVWAAASIFFLPSCNTIYKTKRKSSTKAE